MCVCSYGERTLMGAEVSMAPEKTAAQSSRVTEEAVHANRITLRSR
jgi:hypothetical protein